MEVSKENITLDTPVEDVSVDLPEQTESLRITADEADAGSPDEPQFQMPDKFEGKSAEDIAKAYMELEKMKSKPAEEPEVQPEGTEAEEEAAAAEPEDKPEGEIQDIDVSELTVEGFQDLWQQQGGQLAESQWDAVQKKTGLPMETLKQWEAYVKADVGTAIQTHDQNVYTEAGGEEAYNKMLDWAEANYNQEQIEALNAQLDNPHFYKDGLKILKSQFEASEGKEPSVTMKNNASHALVGGDEFHSDNEMFAAMNHPEYGKGGKYDREFDAKSMRWMQRSGQLK